MGRFIKRGLIEAAWPHEFTSIKPRLDGLAKGDRVDFRGDYEWSDKGGTVHWTHHDPSGRHQAGWLRWNGRTSS